MCGALPTVISLSEWSCGTCSFLNSSDLETCLICAFPRTTVEPSAPLDEKYSQNSPPQMQKYPDVIFSEKSSFNLLLTILRRITQDTNNLKIRRLNFNKVIQKLSPCAIEHLLAAGFTDEITKSGDVVMILPLGQNFFCLFCVIRKPQLFSVFNY
jgi:hypothetical protein